MINRTKYEQEYWNNYKPNGTFYCINDPNIVMEGSKDSKIRLLNSSWVRIIAQRCNNNTRH
jgi:hypothetical protein